MFVWGYWCCWLHVSFLRVRLPEIVHQTEIDDQGKRVSLWSHRLFVFGLIALFAYEVAEISINSFFINYVVEQNWMNARYASLILSFGGLGLFMLGRFLGSWIMRRIRAEKMLFWCATGTVLTTTVVLLDMGIASLIALLLGYAFEAIMFPTIFALALKGLGSHTKRASSFLMMSPVGGVVGRFIDGFCSRPYSFYGMGVCRTLGSVCGSVAICPENAFRSKKIIGPTVRF